MRILCVSNLWPPYTVGGAEAIASVLMEELAGRGHDITCITIGPKDCDQFQVLDGVAVHRMSPRNGLWFFDGRKRGVARKTLWHVRDAWNPEVGRSLRRILDEVRPQVVHSHNIDGMSPVVWSVAKQAGLPVVHTAHDFHLLCPKTTLLRSDGTNCSRSPLPCLAYRWWYRLQSRNIDVLCAPSQFVLEFHTRTGIKAADCRIVRNGVRQRQTSVPSAGTGKLRLLYLGQLEPHKGIRTILAAMNLLADRGDLRLSVAGRGSLEESVVQASRQDDRITFRGFVQDDAKAGLLAESDVLLVPSLWYENAPVSVIEAYTHGLAVVAGRTGGLPEMVEDGVTGRLITPGDAEELASVVAGLCEATEECQRLRAGARERAVYHSSARMADEYEQVYRSVLARE